MQYNSVFNQSIAVAGHFFSLWVYQLNWMVVGTFSYSVWSQTSATVNKIELLLFDSIGMENIKDPPLSHFTPLFHFLELCLPVCFWVISFLFYPELSFVNSVTHLCLFEIRFNWSNPLKYRENLKLYVGVNEKKKKKSESEVSSITPEY